MRQLKKIYIINLHRHTVQHFKALISITIHTFKKIKYPDSFCHELVSLLCSSMLRYPAALQEVTYVGIMTRRLGRYRQHL